MVLFLKTVSLIMRCWKLIQNKVSLSWVLKNRKKKETEKGLRNFWIRENRRKTHNKTQQIYLKMEDLYNNNENDIRYVVKRTGTKVPFEVDKIEMAILKAMNSIDAV